MAEAFPQVSKEQFCCPICLDVLSEPVTTACGHTFCMGCINHCWDQEGLAGSYRCPQCRHTFSSRPSLKKNVAFAEMMEQFSKTGLRSPIVGAAHVECDICIGRKHQAVKSCLVCLASYCGTHLEPHYQSPAFKSHKLVKATKKFQEQLCSQHRKPLEIYCNTDHACICYQCLMDQHRGHKSATVEAERAERQKELRWMQARNQQEIKQKEKELAQVKKAVESHKRSVQVAVEDSKLVFNELIRLVERKRSEVTSLIRAQEKEVLKRADSLLKQLQQDIDLLRTRASEMEQLYNTEDHVHFLQSFSGLSSTPDLDPAAGPTLSTGPAHCGLEGVSGAVRQLRSRMEQFCSYEMEQVCSRVTRAHFLPPSTRHELLQYACQLSVDGDTINSYLHLSAGGSVVSWSQLPIFYPELPQRFDAWAQLLCRESIGGRAYWEVELQGGGGGAGVAVAYESVSRKEEYECVFGYNALSWSLACLPSTSSSSSFTFTFWHDSQDMSVPAGTMTATTTSLATASTCHCRVGVYVDHEAGVLDFYLVSDSTTTTLLHRVRTHFTQPLYPGFWLGPGSSLTLVQMPK